MTLTLRYQDGKEIEAPFVVLKQNADCKLLDGVLVINSPANNEHEDIFSYLIIIDDHAVLDFYVINDFRVREMLGPMQFADLRHYFKIIFPIQTKRLAWSMHARKIRTKVNKRFSHNNSGEP